MRLGLRHKRIPSSSENRLTDSKEIRWAQHGDNWGSRERGSLPKFKARGRAGSRALAFVTSAAGYTVGTLYAFLSGATPELKFIFSGYMIALIALTVFNKVFKLKASGHACGILGPLLYAVHFFGINWIIPCSVAAVAVVWASLYRKSHTPKELALGALCAAVGFFVGLI